MVRVLIVGVVFILAGACGSAPRTGVSAPSPTSPRAAEPPVDPPLPLDPRISQGKLESGLSYFVLPNKKPEGRAQLWLAVNAGSVFEDEDQRGLAHFVEHMAFNGTRRFPKQALVTLLEKSGLRFGPDLNARTSFEDTVYMLQVPTDAPGLVDQAVAVLRDWADGISFEPDEVEKERPVVLEEWRLGRGAVMRLIDKQAPVLFRGSKYAERLPIGKPEVIQRAPREALIRYYRDWYRPDRMAVVAVGDFQPAEMERRIRTEFASLKMPAAPRSEPIVELPGHGATLISVEADPEMPVTSVAIVSKLPHRSEKSEKDYRRILSELLFNSMLNERLDELARKADAPFLRASAQILSLVRAADLFQQSASVKHDAVLVGATALMEEVLRVEQHGFLPTELERARARILSEAQHAVRERDRRDSGLLASEVVRYFMEDEAMPGPEAELALAQKLLPVIALAELNQLGKMLGAGSRVVLVAGPSQMARPSEAELLAAIGPLQQRRLEPPGDALAAEQLMQKKPSPGSIVKIRQLPELGVTEWMLNNGIRVVVKPTEFRNDELLLAAFSPGGHSRVKDSEFASARFADTIVEQSGVAEFDAAAVRKLLAGKMVTASVRIGELEEGFSGKAAPKDREELLQMIHLFATAPRRDESAFASWLSREMERAKNRRASPEAAFFEEMAAVESQNHLRRQPTTPELLSSVQLDKALSVYRDRFADLGDFTFFLVGNIDLEELKPLVETYLGSLPARGRKEAWRDLKVTRPSGVQSRAVRKGTEPKAMLVLSFHGTQRWSAEAENDLAALAESLRLRLREVLRENLGGVYGVMVQGEISRRPRQEYALRVGFGCAPENLEKLEKVVFDQIRSIQEQGFGDEMVLRVKEARLRAHQVSLKDNGYWLRELERVYTHGDEPKQILQKATLLQKVSSESLRAAAKRYLSTKQYIRGVLEPEASGANQTRGGVR